MKSAIYRFILVFVFLSPLVTISVRGQDAIRLHAGKRIERYLTASEKHTYIFDLDSSQFVYGELDQSGVDVVVTVFNPDREQIGKFDVYGRQERFHLETTDAGTYHIEVTLARGDSGNYVIEVKQLESLGNTPEKRMDQLLKAYYKDDEPGGVVAVILNSEITYSRAYGLANLTHGVPFTTETASNIGSVSKQFTGFAIALLEKEGKLSINDDVRKYIPELSDFGQPVTLLNLLNHTSGFREIYKTFPMKGIRGYWNRQELIQSVQRQRELQNAPGSEYRYCNTGYILLAEVVERITGVSFPEWMEANIFGPLCMERTTIKTKRGQIIPNSARGYYKGEGGFFQGDDSDAFYGASNIYTTVGDLSKWLRNLCDARVGGSEVISRMTKRGVLTSGDTLDYSLGLEIDKHRGLRRYSHGGSDGGHRTNMTYYPEINAGIIFLHNERIWPTISQKVTEEFIGGFMEPAETSNLRESQKEDTTEIDPTLLNTYAGRYGGEDDKRLIIRFVKEGTRLRAEVNDPSLPSSLILRAVSDSIFVKEDIDLIVIFHCDTNRQVKLVTFQWYSEDFTLRRLPPFAPSEADLSAYAGLYYSSELESVYKIVIEHKQLKNSFTNLILMPKELDIFTDLWLGEYRFERSDDGNVSSFIVQNVRFEKLK